MTRHQLSGYASPTHSYIVEEDWLDCKPLQSAGIWRDLDRRNGGRKDLDEKKQTTIIYNNLNVIFP